MLGQRLHAITLGRMVAGGDKGHPRFGRQMGLRFGDFTGHEHINPGSYGAFKITLRPARAPTHSAEFAAISARHHHRPIKLPLELRAQCCQTLRHRQGSGKTEILLAKPSVRLPAKEPP